MLMVTMVIIPMTQAIIPINTSICMGVTVTAGVTTGGATGTGALTAVSTTGAPVLITASTTGIPVLISTMRTSLGTNCSSPVVCKVALRNGAKLNALTTDWIDTGQSSRNRAATHRA